MKKIIFFAASAALALASCSSDDSVATDVAQTNDGAINFSAYTSSSVTTRGTVETTDTFKIKGIGVFAFYQPATNGVEGPDYTTVKYPTPNFMYNQNVTLNKANGYWSYTPVKYWPNNTNDKLSFFAYAPYSATATWEDLGIKTDATGKTITKTFDIYNDVNDQKDYLFANPVTNMKKPSTVSNHVSNPDTIADIDTTTASDKIIFNFKHVTSKVNLFVGVTTDSTKTMTNTEVDTCRAWKDPNTTIEIKSIEFKDLYTTMTWTNSSSNWTYSGAQDIKVLPSSVDHADTIQSKTWTKDKWHRYLACEDTLKTDTTTWKDEYMFIAPQTLKNQEIVITYVVKTADPAEKNNSHKYNSSEITNVITKTWADFATDGINFEAGKQYKLFFLIGMQSVKIAASVADWEDGTNNYINVPSTTGY